MIDKCTGLSAISKRPWEQLIRNIPFAGLMAEGDTLSSVTSVTSTLRTSGTDTLTIGTPSFSGTDVQALYSGGAEGDVYLIHAKAVTTAGEHLQRDVVLKVV